MLSTCQPRIELIIERIGRDHGVAQLGLNPTVATKEKGSGVLPTLQSLW